MTVAKPTKAFPPKPYPEFPLFAHNNETSDKQYLTQMQRQTLTGPPKIQAPSRRATLLPFHWQNSLKGKRVKKPNTVILFLVTLTFILSLANAQAQQPLKSSETPKQGASADPESKTVPNTPEYALRKFLLATCLGDVKTLKKFSHPHDDIEILIPDEKLPETALEQIKAVFKGMPITKLKVGDSVDLPSGRSVTFDATKINEKKAMLTFPNNPLPFPVALIDGQWKVNPTKIIAVRKAAKRLMQEHNNARQPKPEHLEPDTGTKQQQPK